MVLGATVITILELIQDIQGVKSIRYQEFFIRLIKYVLISRKLSVAYMNLQSEKILATYRKQVHEESTEGKSETEEMMSLLKFVTWNYVKKRDCCLYRDILELMKFLNKGLNSMEDGINKKLESEYENQVNNSKLIKS